MTALIDGRVYKTAAEWTAQNPVLRLGQEGVESDTSNVKLGNGSTAWNSLSYFIQATGSRTLTGVAQATLTGTTAGTAVSTMPETGASFKKVLVFLNGYENTTATHQTITYPTAFTNTPKIVADDSGGSTTTTTTLTLPASMGTTKTGWIIVEGF